MADGIIAPETLDLLTRLGEAATPGLWSLGKTKYTIRCSDNHRVVVIRANQTYRGDGRDGANAKFIAAANPETVLGLVKWAKGVEKEARTYHRHCTEYDEQVADLQQQLIKAHNKNTELKRQIAGDRDRGEFGGT